MGVGSRVLRSAAEYEKFYAPGHMWVTLLEGRHVSSDVAVVNGRAALVAACDREAGRRGHLRLLVGPFRA